MIRPGESWSNNGDLRNRNRHLPYEERTRVSQFGEAARTSALMMMRGPWRSETDCPMIETHTRRPIHVSIDGTASPYIMVPVDQLGFVRTLLDRHESGTGSNPMRSRSAESPRSPSSTLSSPATRARFSGSWMKASSPNSRDIPGEGWRSRGSRLGSD